MEIFTGVVQDVEQKSVTMKHGDSTHARHISSEDIAAFVDDKVVSTRRQAIVLHLVRCERCRKIVSEVVLSQSAIKDPIE